MLTSHSNPPLGQRASDLAFVRDVAQQVLDDSMVAPPWCFEILQAAGEEAMRIAGRAYPSLQGDHAKHGSVPLTVWARSRILKVCKKALREVGCG